MSLKILKKGEISLLKLLNHSKGGDKLIPILAFLISAFGVLMIYSASYYQAELTYNDKYFFLKKQLIGLVIGTISMIFFCFFNYKKLIKMRYVLLAVSFVLLALIFTPLGVENYGARRWLKVGGFTIQPSEIAKFSFIVFCAGYFSENPQKADSFKGVLVPLLVGGGLCVLIMLEPNMSITVLTLALIISMIFVAGCKKRFLVSIIMPVVIMLPILIIIEPYRLKRLMAFINPWESPKGEGYQLLQSFYALGSGGLFGLGLFNSRQKLKFLPFSESDFILSVIGEEFGFVGTFILLIVMLFLCYRCYKSAIKCKEYFGFLLAIGITTVFMLQVLINALVVSGSIPPTGLPLPLISHGNTSLIVYMSAFGVLYNVSKNTENF